MHQNFFLFHLPPQSSSLPRSLTAFHPHLQPPNVLLSVVPLSLPFSPLTLSPFLFLRPFRSLGPSPLSPPFLNSSNPGRMHMCVLLQPIGCGPIGKPHGWLSSRIPPCPSHAQVLNFRQVKQSGVFLTSGVEAPCSWVGASASASPITGSPDRQWPSFGQSQSGIASSGSTTPVSQLD
jgi:hypothetical protein